MRTRVKLLFVILIIGMLSACSTFGVDPHKEDQLLLNVDPLLLEPIKPMITVDQYLTQVDKSDQS